jgi:hypothetical protein
LKSEVNALSQWRHKLVDNVTVAERQKNRAPNQDRPLVGQSPWLLNLGVGYWGDDFGITTSYNHRGYRTNTASVNPNRVEYELAPRQLDLQVYKRFLRQQLEIKFNAANLLDEWTQYYQNQSAYSESKGENGEKIFDLVKGDNKYNRADDDIITYRKKDGRRFNLSLIYSF